MKDTLIVWGVRALALVALFFALRYVAGSTIDFIQAPKEAELQAARGNNAAMQAGVAHQNAGVDALKKDGDQRQARSRAAVQTAGEPDYAHARELEAAPAKGSTPVARAANRINAEFGH